MSHENETQNVLRQIFDAINTPSREWSDRVVMDFIERGSMPSTKTLDKHLNDLNSITSASSGENTSKAPAPTENNDETFSPEPAEADKSTNASLIEPDIATNADDEKANNNESETPAYDEEDAFPVHPMGEENDESKRLRALGKYANHMITLAQLRQHGIGIPDEEVLQRIFTAESNGNIIEKEMAASEFRALIAQSLEEPLERLEKVASYLDRIIDGTGNPQIFKWLLNELGKGQPEAQAVNGYKAENVIDITQYARPSKTL